MEWLEEVYCDMADIGQLLPVVSAMELPFKRLFSVEEQTYCSRSLNCPCPRGLIAQDLKTVARYENEKQRI